MNMIDLIKQYLPEGLRPLAQNFTIPAEGLQQHSDLIVLILESKSLAENNEKQNWFNLLSIMKDEQILKLKEILTREKQKLEEIQQKYAQKQQEITNKYQNMFNAEAYQKAQAQLGAREQQHREQELQEADNLLAQM